MTLEEQMIHAARQFGDSCLKDTPSMREKMRPVLVMAFLNGVREAAHLKLGNGLSYETAALCIDAAAVSCAKEFYFQTAKL